MNCGLNNNSDIQFADQENVLYAIAKFHMTVTARRQLLKQLRHFIWFISVFEFAAADELRDLLNFCCSTIA